MDSLSWVSENYSFHLFCFPLRAEAKGSLADFQYLA